MRSLLRNPLRLRRWLHEHSLKLLAIRDTPEAIAGGVAIGIFFGFMPLFGLKTVLAIFCAWVTGSNILAAVLAGALHDVLLPLMPIIYRWEYDLGYLILNSQLPPHLTTRFHWEGFEWRRWFFGIGKPLILGGAVISPPFAVLSYFVTRGIIVRHRRKKQAQTPAPPPDEAANPT